MHAATVSPTNRPRPPARRARLRRLVLMAVIALAMVVTAACGADDAGVFDGVDMASEPVPDRMADVPAMEFADDDVAAMDAAEAGMPPPVPGGAPTGQQVIRTAELVLESDDTAAMLTEVTAIAERYDGYVATSDLSRTVDGEVTGWLTLRVPSGLLDRVVDAIEEAADAVPVSRTDEFDVSREMTDIEARLSNLRAFETELVALLAEVRASDGGAEELLTVFERIRQVRLEIEQLEAHRASLSDQVAMSTVWVEIRQLPAPPTASDVTWAPGDTLREAFAATVRSLTMVADAIIWVVVTALPLIIAVLAVPALFIWWLLARRRRDAAAAEDAASDDDSHSDPTP